MGAQPPLWPRHPGFLTEQDFRSVPTELRMHEPLMLAATSESLLVHRVCRVCLNLDGATQRKWVPQRKRAHLQTW